MVPQPERYRLFSSLLPTMPTAGRGFGSGGRRYVRDDAARGITSLRAL